MYTDVYAGGCESGHGGGVFSSSASVTKCGSQRLIQHISRSKFVPNYDRTIMSNMRINVVSLFDSAICICQIKNAYDQLEDNAVAPTVLESGTFTIHNLGVFKMRFFDHGEIYPFGFV